MGAAVAFGLMGMAEAIRQRCTCLTLDELHALRGPGFRTWDEVCERCKGYP